MFTTISLYTDASVKGDFFAPGERRKYGPAMAAWCAWGKADFDLCPLFIGAAYVGNWGPNGAEYQALIQGLSAMLAWLNAETGRAAIEIAVYCDNTWVVHQLNGHLGVDKLAPHYNHAKQLLRQLRETGSVVSVVKANGEPGHKRAHSLSTQAWNTILLDKSWRPQRQYRAPVPVPVG
ncbi:MAG: hypothetical protein WBQ41_03545 [Solirubrobacterales bacterium]